MNSFDKYYHFFTYVYINSISNHRVNVQLVWHIGICAFANQSILAEQNEIKLLNISNIMPSVLG